MNLIENHALCFDDVLLVPQHSTINSRKDVDTSTVLTSDNCPFNINLKIPILSASMNSITEEVMASAMFHNGGIGVVHRYNTIEQQLEIAKKVKDSVADTFFALGANKDYYDRATALHDFGARLFCIDIAHGDSKLVVEAIKKIKNSLKNVFLIAGNVATDLGALKLVEAGADAVKLSIGSGSLCSTRIVTGCGLPTLQSIIDVKEYFDKLRVKRSIIADGGIKNSGDIVKSLAAGADAVMLGSLLSGTDECPGDIIEKNGAYFKRYFGMASKVAQSEWRPETKNTIVPEGESTLVPYKGSVKDILFQLVGGLRSGMTYCNARDLRELYENAEFIKITNNGLTESKPHLKL